MKLTRIFAGALASALVIMPSLTVADSQLSIGGAGTTAQANLDFRITIPSFVYFQIGSAGSVDRVDYDLNVGPVQPGSGGPIAATGGVADGADGSLSVILATNAASVSIAASGGNLTSGGGYPAVRGHHRGRHGHDHGAGLRHDDYTVCAGRIQPDGHVVVHV